MKQLFNSKNILTILFSVTAMVGIIAVTNQLRGILLLFLVLVALSFLVDETARMLGIAEHVNVKEMLLSLWEDNRLIGIVMAIGFAYYGFVCRVPW